MVYNHVFHPDALDEYKQALTWYKKRSKKAAGIFVLEVEERIQAIVSNPLRYRNTYKNFREAPLKKFPYSIVYFVDQETNIIVLTSIFHEKRNPKEKYLVD